MRNYAIKSGNANKPLSWQRVEEFADDRAVAQIEIKADDTGVGLYKLRRYMAKHPKSLPGQLSLAETLIYVGEGEDAAKLFWPVIRSDAGRTDLSIRALLGLAKFFEDSKRPAQRIYCLSAAAPIRNELSALLSAHKLSKLPAQLDTLDESIGSTTGGGSVSDAPTVKFLKETGEKLDSADLYERAVESVVLIDSGDGTGSGVCVAPNLILTNAHVVSGDSVSVHTFISKRGKVKRLPAASGRVVYRSDSLDVALVKLDDENDFLVPLPVAAQTVRTGQKVYAIGSPGLGDRVLDQSLTEGIVSNNSRTIDGQSYLQHTAAINPGNSGGPLLNDRCQVVGLITLKAKLENVGFAIPLEVLLKHFR
jgi:S1-C subfamily serine protease